MELNIEKIEREIRVLGWSKAEFCRRAHILPSTLTMIFARRSTTLSTITKIARALGLDPKELLI